MIFDMIFNTCYSMDEDFKASLQLTNYRNKTIMFGMLL